MVDWIYDLNPFVFKAGLFVIITMLAFASRGSKAVRYSTSLVKSGVVNVIFYQLNTLLSIPLFLVAIAIIKGAKQAGMPSLPREIWDGVPILLTYLILCLSYDFVLYWVHRALHKTWFWPMHAVHHSDPDLHFLSWDRAHFTEQVFIQLSFFFALSWMGMTLNEVVILALARNLHQYYVHSNIDWDHGRFNVLLASPQYHRWHHADDPAAYDKNFASSFPIWDKLFGTYYYPGTCVNTPTGFPGSPGNDIIDLVLYPFKEWARLLGKRVSKLEATKSDIKDPIAPAE